MIFIFIISAFLIWFFLIYNPNPSPKQRVKKHMKEGIKLYKADLLEEAISEFEKAYNYADKHEATNISAILAAAYQDIKQYSKSLEHYKKADHLVTNNHHMLIDRAKVYRELNMFDEAIKDLELAFNMGSISAFHLMDNYELDRIRHKFSTVGKEDKHQSVNTPSMDVRASKPDKGINIFEYAKKLKLEAEMQNHIADDELSDDLDTDIKASPESISKAEQMFRDAQKKREAQKNSQHKNDAL